jgi:transcriptional regulator with XRE-family HTH domain
MAEAFDMPNDRRMFRDRLVARMREQKITGAELARQANLSKDAISTYTTMRSLPTPKTLERLARVLKCKPAELIPVKPVSESFIELREAGKPGHKVVVAKIVLPTLQAVEVFQGLYALEAGLRDSRIANTEKK